MATTIPPKPDVANAAERAANLISVLGLACDAYETCSGALDVLGALNRATGNATDATPNVLNAAGLAARERLARWLVQAGHTPPVHDEYRGFDPLETISRWSDRAGQQHVTRILRQFAEEARPMPDRIAYRSRAPRALAVWEAYQKQREAFNDQLRATLAELGLTGRDVLRREHHVVGVRYSDGDIPDGWRVSADKPDMIIPDRRTRDGKAVAKTLGALRIPDPRDDLPGGMPGEVMDWDRASLLVAGLTFAADALYVTFQAPRMPEEYAEHIDPDIWEQVPLSVYYAAVEQQEVAGETS